MSVSQENCSGSYALCTSRSRAIQIGLNLGILEEWIEDAALPAGILNHLAPTRELLIWLQVQTLKFYGDTIN